MEPTTNALPLFSASPFSVPCNGFTPDPPTPFVVLLFFFLAYLVCF